MREVRSNPVVVSQRLRELADLTTVVTETLAPALQLDEVLREAGIGVVIVDGGGLVMSANGMFADIVNAPNGDSLLGVSVEDFLPEEKREQHAHNRTAAAEKANAERATFPVRQLDTEILTVDDTRVRVRIAVMALQQRHGGDPAGIAVVWRVPGHEQRGERRADGLGSDGR